MLKTWLQVVLASVFAIIVSGLIVKYLIVKPIEQAIPEIRVLIPGEQLVDSLDSGSYIVFWEYKTTMDSVNYSSDSIPYELEFEMINSESGTACELESIFEQFRYVSPDRAGVSLLRCMIPVRGSYLLKGNYLNKNNYPLLVIALATEKEFSTFLLTPVISFLVLVVLFFIAGFWVLKRLIVEPPKV